MNANSQFAPRFLGIAFVLLFLGAGCKTAWRDETGVARVVRMKGNARSDLGRSEWRSVTVQSNCFPRSTWVIQTAAQSYLDLKFADSATFSRFSGRPVPGSLWVWKTTPPPGSHCASHSRENLLRLLPDSTLKIESLEAQRLPHRRLQDFKQIRLWLQQGAAFVSVQNLKVGTSFSIRTDRATAVVNDTNTAPAVFRFTSDGVIEVESGAVPLVQSDPDLNVTIPAGDRYDVRTGQVTKLSKKMPCLCTPIYAWPVPVAETFFRRPERKF